MKKSLPELLAPAGSYQAVLAAVLGGADAVYLGGSAFNARAFAENLTDDFMKRAIDYCHAHNVRVYVTLNTLLYDKELPAFLDYARLVDTLGADAVIVADVGAISLLHRELPNLNIHASTQASVHSADGVRALAASGAVRVVLARELSRDNLAALLAETDVQTEVFVHGALCVSFSGQCLFSSLVGGRSGNRGQCAQPCRLPYNGENYPLSLQDLSLAAHIPTLIDMGVSSLKIEGRMKSPAYVYHVCRIFRRLLDERRGATDGELAELAAVFSRGGLTDRYFENRANEKMTGIRTEDDKATSRLFAEYTPTEEKVALGARLALQADAPTRLTLWKKARPHECVTLEGPTPEPARAAETDRARLTSQLVRMGDTPFSLADEDVTVQADTPLFLPVSFLNKLRREAVAKLLGHNRDSGSGEGGEQAPYAEKKRAKKKTAHQIAVVERMEQFDALCRFYGEDSPAAHKKESVATDGVPTDLLHAHGIGRDRGGFDLVFLSYLALLGNEHTPFATLPDGVVIPPVVTETERAEVLTALRRFRTLGVTYALVDNIGALSLSREAGLIPYGGMRLNITNSETAAFYEQAGLVGMVLSPELSLPQARDIPCGTLPVYGYLPLMLTERCFIRETAGGGDPCALCGKTSLTDRRGVTFPLMRAWPHRNVILNSRPLYLFDKQKELSASNMRGGAAFFTHESAERTQKILAMRQKKEKPDTDIRRIDM